MELKKVDIQPSNRKGKKFRATFTRENGRTKTVHFGASGFEDYTQHKDKDRREQYLKRHAPRENWTEPDNAGSLSRWLLWGPSTSFKRNLNSFKKRFKLNQKVIEPEKVEEDQKKEPSPETEQNG